MYVSLKTVCPIKGGNASRQVTEIDNKSTTKVYNKSLQLKSTTKVYNKSLQLKSTTKVYN